MAKREASEMEDQVEAKQPKAEDVAELSIFETFLRRLTDPKEVTKAKNSPDFNNYMARDRTRYRWFPTKKVLDYLYNNMKAVRPKIFSTNIAATEANIISPTLMNFVQAPLKNIANEAELIELEKVFSEGGDSYVIESVKDIKKEYALPKLVLIHAVIAKQNYLLDFCKIGITCEPIFLRIFSLPRSAFYTSLKEANLMFNAWGFGLQNAFFLDVILGPKVIAELPELYQLAVAAGFDLDNDADIISTSTQRLPQEISTTYWKMAQQINIWAAVALHAAGKSQEFAQKCRKSFSKVLEINEEYGKDEFYQDEGVNIVRPKYVLGKIRW